MMNDIRFVVFVAALAVILAIGILGKTIEVLS